jgi:LuxR family maltose regulon positive regulatory protein
VQPGLGEDLHALALTSLGIAEVWAGRFEEAEPHLEQGVALARRIGRPYLEFRGLAHQVTIEIYRSSYARAEERSRQAIELAEQHGWTDDPAAGTAYVMLTTVLVWLGRPGEAESCVERAERTVRAEADPAPALAVCYVRGTLELARGRDGDALAAFRAAERQAGHLVAPHYLVPLTRAMLVHALVRLGELEQAEQLLGGLDAQDRDRGETRIVASVLRLAQGDPRAATAVLAPVLDGSAPLIRPGWLVEGFLLEAIARDELGDPVAAERALERTLDVAGPSGAVLIFLLHPVPGLLERHARHCTAHASLIGEILSVLTGKVSASLPGGPQPPLEPLSNSEIRVLRYLPTNLSGPEIANELSISPNTVKTHIHNLYAKLGTHRRGEAVACARALGLLAPSAPRR